MLWIPRANGIAAPPVPVPMTPPIRYGDAPYSYPSPPPSGAIAGPTRLGDALAAKVPIITDSVATEASPAPPAGARVNGGFPLVPSTQHLWHGKVDQCNQGYADGHVDVVPADFLKPQYLSGGLWNWR
jgi:prepilin-type processing-associated H-X9-DG protein